MDENLRELYQEIILDHSRHPRHFGALPSANHVAEGFNPLCGDRVKVYLQVDASNRITDVSFEGRGCAISVASASLMTEMLKGRDIEDAEKLMGGFLDMVKGEDVGGLDTRRPGTAGSDGRGLRLSDAGEMRDFGLARDEGRAGQSGHGENRMSEDTNIEVKSEPVSAEPVAQARSKIRVKAQPCRRRSWRRSAMS